MPQQVWKENDDEDVDDDDNDDDDVVVVVVIVVGKYISISFEIISLSSIVISFDESS